MIQTAIPARVGCLALDADGSTPKERRVRTTINGVETGPETVEGLGDFAPRKASDVANAFTLKANNNGGKLLPRGGYGSWSFAVPMQKTKDGWFPLDDVGNVNKDFDPTWPTIFGNPNPPDGTVAVIVATTGHGKRQLVGVLSGAGTSGNPIISHWLPDNPPTASTHIFDMKGTSVNPLVHAGFHTFTRVLQYAEPCDHKKTSVVKQNKYAVALNGTDLNGDKTGLLFTHFAGANAMLSYEAWGPLRFATSYHTLNSLGDRSGAIDTDALYTGGNPEYDMPLPFEEKDENNPAIGIYDYRVFLWRRKKWKRDWLCEKKERRWDLHVKLPVFETPPCNPTKVPDKKTGVPSKIYQVANMVMAGGFFASQGIVFTGRPTLLYGRWPNSTQ